ncbi:MAG: hypothetical protein WCC57_11580 [Paracoccaceae bacterium]
MDWTPTHIVKTTLTLVALLLIGLAVLASFESRAIGYQWATVAAIKSVALHWGTKTNYSVRVEDGSIVRATVPSLVVPFAVGDTICVHLRTSVLTNKAARWADPRKCGESSPQGVAKP